jgi:hypothetical protein
VSSDALSRSPPPRARRAGRTRVASRLREGSLGRWSSLFTHTDRAFGGDFERFCDLARSTPRASRRARDARARAATGRARARATAARARTRSTARDARARDASDRWARATTI